MIGVEGGGKTAILYQLLERQFSPSPLTVSMPKPPPLAPKTTNIPTNVPSGIWNLPYYAWQHYATEIADVVHVVGSSNEAVIENMRNCL
jgi:hypothetical protein